VSLESTVNQLKKIKYTTLGMIIGASAALLVSELGLVEVEMSVGYILGLCIGIAIDSHKNNKLA